MVSGKDMPRTAAMRIEGLDNSSGLRTTGRYENARAVVRAMRQAAAAISAIAEPAPSRVSAPAASLSTQPVLSSTFRHLDEVDLQRLPSMMARILKDMSDAPAATGAQLDRRA